MGTERHWEDERFDTIVEPAEDEVLDLDAILHPARKFAHPSDVVQDPRLSLQEKRAILSSWASDACAVESAPALRTPAGVPRPVRFKDVIDALQSLDATARSDTDRSERISRRRRTSWGRGRRSGSESDGGIGATG